MWLGMSCFRALARNLILGYFHTPSNKKQEVINVISRALDFEGDELMQLQGEASGGWLRGLFKKVVATQTPSTPKHDASANKSFFGEAVSLPQLRPVRFHILLFISSSFQSFSEALVKFMEKESTPELTPRLPAEAMAQQINQSQQRSSAPVFNPFTTSLTHSATSTAGATPARPLQVSTATQSSHLLMAPISPSMPMFSSSLVTVPSSPDTRTAVTSVTPVQNSSAILKSVLQDS